MMLRQLLDGVSMPLKWLLSSLIRVYQIVISPLLGPNCRYQPTCSHYCLQALQMHGLRKGMWLGGKRIARCHPWGGHGYDPVPGCEDNQAGSDQAGNDKSKRQRD